MAEIIITSEPYSKKSKKTTQ